MTRLDFVLPPFTRVIWVTEMARDIWEARLNQIVAAWIEVEWRSVCEGLRQCASVDVPLRSFGQFAKDCEDCGLIARALEVNLFEPGGNFCKADPLGAAEPRLEVLVGRPGVVEAGANAWRSGDESALGTLFGYPQCCVQQFIMGARTARLVDPIWRTFGNVVTGDPLPFLITGEFVPELHCLCHRLGIRGIPHSPCDRQCEESRRLSAALISFGRKIGREAEMECLLEVLTWPMEWSALHGIAELKTPVFKATMNTDATAQKYIVRSSGSKRPSEAAHGVRFPYLVRNRKAYPETASDLGFPSSNPPDISASLQAPESVVARSNSEAEKWYYADNGFSSRATMEKEHAPIVALALRELSQGGSSILDLGCGNGALLRSICNKMPSAVAYGVDRSTSGIAHAKILLPPFASNFCVSDIFESLDMLTSRRFDVVLFMPGRLLEVARETADILLGLLRRQSRRIIFYVYPDYPVGTLREVCLQFGVAFTEVNSTTGIAELSAMAENP